MKLLARNQNKPRVFVPDSNPEWSLGSCTDATPDDQFERLSKLMFEHEATLESLAVQFGTASHRQAFQQWNKLYHNLNKQAGVISS